MAATARNQGDRIGKYFSRKGTAGFGIQGVYRARIQHPGFEVLHDRRARAGEGSQPQQIPRYRARAGHIQGVGKNPVGGTSPYSESIFQAARTTDRTSTGTAVASRKHHHCPGCIQSPDSSRERAILGIFDAHSTPGVIDHIGAIQQGIIQGSQQHGIRATDVFIRLGEEGFIDHQISPRCHP